MAGHGRKSTWASLALYAGLGLVFFGLPVLDNPGGEVVGANDIEPSAYVWMLAWWPHALGETINPFVTHAIYAPEGFNLTWATSIPGPSLVLWPVTALAGPIVSYNLLALAAPPLAAWTAFLLCRRLTGAVGPSLFGGYLFGFSPYMLANLQGVPNLTFVALLPAVVLLVVMHVAGELSTPRFVALLAAALVFQYLTSNEILALLTLFGALAGALAVVLMPDRRAAMWDTGKAAALAYGIAILVLSPVLWWTFFEPSVRPAHAVPEDYSSDLLSFVFPSGVQRLGRRTFADLATSFGGEGGGTGGGGRAYLGLPLLAIVLWYAIERWGRPAARLMVAMAGVTAIASLGPKLHVAGFETVPMPWKPLSELPLLQYAIPATIAVFTMLVVSAIAASWLAFRPGLTRWVLALLAIAFLLPNLGSGRWDAPAPTPEFFAGDGWKRRLDDGERVFTVPYVGAGQRWQARNEIAWDLAGGYIGELPADYGRFYRRIAMLVNAPSPAASAEVRRFLDRKGVSAVALDATLPGGWQTLFAPLDPRPVREGGVVLYRLRSSA